MTRNAPKTRQWRQSAVDPSITVKDYADHWLRVIKSTVKGRTHTRYNELLDIHIMPVFGDVKVQQLHRGRIKSFLAEKLTELKPSRLKPGRRQGKQRKE